MEIVQLLIHMQDTQVPTNQLRSYTSFLQELQEIHIQLFHKMLIIKMDIQMLIINLIGDYYPISMMKVMIACFSGDIGYPYFAHY